MKRLSFLVLALSLLFVVNVFAANKNIAVMKNLDWANDPRSMAFSTKGLTELLPPPAEPSNGAAFGSILAQWTWSQMGITDYGYMGAGISISYSGSSRYLYLVDQYNYRIYVLDASSVPTFGPTALTWAYAYGNNYLPWGAGMDNEPQMWWGDVGWGYSTMLWEVQTYPPWMVFTGSSFESYYVGGYNWYYWEADLSDNKAGDTLFFVNVGYTNHIVGATEPAGGYVRDFGEATWDWVSQRALGYDNDDGTFFTGGWNVNTMWEIDPITGTPIPGRSFGCTYPASAAYQDVAHGGPYLYVQDNNYPDNLYLYSIPVMLADDIAVAGILKPNTPFLGPDPIKVKAKIANLGTQDQSFDTWVVVTWVGGSWTSSTISTSLAKMSTGEYEYDEWPNGLLQGSTFTVCVYISNPGDMDNSNDNMCMSAEITRSCTPYVHDQGIVSNAVYFYDYGAVIAKEMRTSDTRPASLAWAGVNTISKGDPYYPWPDPVYDPIEINAFTDDNLDGTPGNNPVWADTVKPTDVPDWVWAMVPECRFLGAGGGVWVGFRNISPGREGICGDPSQLYSDNWYQYGGTWYHYSVLGTDMHIRGCLEYPPLVTIKGLQSDLVFDCPRPWAATGYVTMSFQMILCGHVAATFHASDLVHETLPMTIPGSYVSFSPASFVGEGGQTIDASVTIGIPVGTHAGKYCGTIVLDYGTGSEEYPLCITVGGCLDLDIQDYAGNLSANTMDLTGLKEGCAIGTFTLVNPNCLGNNVDLFDGPGNTDLTNLTYTSTYLMLCGKSAKCKGVSMVEFKNNGPDAYIEVYSEGRTWFAGNVLNGETFVADARPGKLGTDTKIIINGGDYVKVHTSCSKPIYVGMVWGDFELVAVERILDYKYAIPPANVTVAFTGGAVLPSGQALQGIVQVDIPKSAKNHKYEYDYAYCGWITVTGIDANGDAASDNFKVHLMVLKGKEGGEPCGFWGENEGAANTLHWANFGLSENGYALYRNELRIADLGSGEHEYTDPVTSSATFEYKLGVKIGGSEIMIGPISVGGAHTPAVFSLSQNNPNPAGDRTSISYTVAEAGNVTIGVFNAAGMLVKTLVNEYTTPGIYTVNWDNMALSNGVYFYRLSAGDITMTKKMVVLK